MDWNAYQMRWRTMDPQIGRFLQIDPLANDYKYNSTYSYAENRVISGIDLEGLEYLPINSSWYRMISYEKQQIGPPMVYERQSIEVVVKNVPKVFKDDSGNPLFSAYDVSHLPKFPDWPFRIEAADPEPTASTGGWFMGMNSLEENKAFADRVSAVGSIGQELSLWGKLIRRTPIWKAYSKLGENNSALRNARMSSDYYESFLSGVAKSQYGKSRSDIINFVLDGTLPEIDINNIKSSVGNCLEIMYYGFNVMKTSQVTIDNDTYKTYNVLLAIYNSFDQKFNSKEKKEK